MFPLASPYSGIVHHLSGRNRHALTQIPPQRDLGSVDDAPPASGESGALATAGQAPPSLSLRPRVCHPETRTHVALLGPCFKTGRMRPFGHQRLQRKVRPTKLPARRDRRQPLTAQWQPRPPTGSRAVQPPGGLRCNVRRLASSPQSSPERPGTGL